MPTTNSRCMDVIKAAKYHYGHGNIPDRIRNVVAFHNCVTPESLQDIDVLMVLVCDTGQLVFSCTQDSTRFITECAANYRMCNYINATQDAMRVMLTTYIHSLTFLSPESFGGSLPANCPMLEQYLDSPH